MAAYPLVAMPHRTPASVSAARSSRAPGSAVTDPSCLPVLGGVRLLELNDVLGRQRPAGLPQQALLRETGRSLSAEDIVELQQAHAAEYRKQLGSVTALPGARELLAALTDAGVRWGIATSGYAATARSALELLGLPEDTPMVTRDLVRHAKPDPDLFLAAAALLGVDPRNTMVVGDSVWDLLAARRAGALGIGLQSGGYGREELERAGAYRVYADPAEMLARLDEAGVRSTRLAITDVSLTARRRTDRCRPAQSWR